MPRQDFSRRLKSTPTRPGVYLMRDASQCVLYVGKAAILRHRVRSYFASSTNLAPKIRRMVKRVADFEYIVTESEQEAVILECNLIKEHKPPYNARLKDDKSYPFIKIDLSEDFPQVYITRRVSKDGARYFGPFASAISVRRTLGLLKKLFPYRSCTKTITGTDERPCLDFHIHRCIGPCIGAVDKAQYREVVDQVTLFMEGKTDRVVKSIARRMHEAADQLEFERAAALRDQLTAIEKVHEGQKVLHLTSENLDVVAASISAGEAWVEVFFVRQGKLVGRDHFIMEGTEDDEPQKVLSAFVKQFYDTTPYVPPRILVQHSMEDSEAIEKWLSQKRDGTVKVHVPQRGEKRRLVQMVAENAAQGLEQLRVKQMSDEALMDTAMTEVQEALSLPRLPRRIECYDISNIQGTNSVGSMAVFENGAPKSSHYRRFKIKTIEGIDDYSMMREVLSRRFRRLAKSKDGSTADSSGATSGRSKDESWGIVPDLVLIDGGKGHLGAALQVFLELGIDSVPLASLAKEEEELFVPQVPEPIVLPRSSQGLFLMQRLRDEAHRFAITFHRERRSKNSIRSALDLVPGIGPKRRKLLITRFGSVKGIQAAELEDIAAVPGMTMKQARTVKEYL
ncbi:MAG: excinuclease ABC subunit UvrC [Chloroflexi bacterium]|nr:excinuclease ABC subunit UvrC [Chloroflexota bacterium]